MASASLRPATTADTRIIEGLLESAQLPTHGVKDILGATPADFVIAEEDGRAVAAGGLEVTGDGALLRSIVVREDQRSTGVGRRVVERLLGDADSRGLDVYLLTTTADAWFPRFGFARVERAQVPSGIGATWEFKTGCAETAVAMRRTRPGT
jgi:amino-acid N-acetyltransferase